MMGISGSCGFDQLDHAPGRRDAPALELVLGQAARPAVEDLQRAGAGLDLADQIIGRALDQEIDEMLERRSVAIGKQPRRRLVLAAAALDHIGRDRPRRAAKADQRHVLGKRGDHTLDRLVDRR